MDFHVPVMVREVVEGLVVDAGGIYLDATVGGGGHSLAILQALREEGRLIAADRDPAAVQQAQCALAPDSKRVIVMQGSFGQLKELLVCQEIESLNGALFDLGVSSAQLDRSQRGFSFRQSGPLDMRMDSTQVESAAEWLARISEEELVRVIREYGEERQARRIARTIIQLRQVQALTTTGDLRRAVESTRPQMLTKTLARVFQAVRIAVNDELGQLDRGLETAIEWLAPGGRLVVIAYHSLEDRLVKRKLNALVQGCVCPPAMPVCVCGKKPTFKKAQRRPLRTSAGELQHNRRARSAVLRVYEKL